MKTAAGPGSFSLGVDTLRKGCFHTLIFLFLATVWLLAAAPAEAQNYRFNTVQIEGNERIESATILSRAGIARGQTVSAGDLNRAFQNLQESGLFESVDLDPRGSTLVISVVEYPTINLISFEGNRRIDDDELGSLVESQSRRVFSPTIADQDAARIIEAYAQQGRVSARVNPRIIRRADNRVDLVFEVFEGDNIEIERVSFVGNDTFSDRRLRRVLGTKQAGLLRAFIRSDTFIEDRIEFDRQVLRDFYLSRGFVDFRTTGVSAELTRARDGYFVTFNIEEGQQFTFGEITTSSDLEEIDTDEFLAALRIRPGVTYSPSLVENSIARLERLATQKGLNFIRVAPRVTRNDRTLTLDIDFAINRGDRIFVERIDIEGNATTLDRVVRRQFRIVEGDPFNPREIREAAERIRALGFFVEAEVEAREGTTPNQVIVDVDVEEQPTGSLTFGGSYSNSAGFGLVASFREDNFLGRGQQLRFSISTTSDNVVYELGFTEPAFLGRDVAFNLDLSYRESDDEDSEYDTNIGRFQPSFSFPVGENTRLALRYTADYAEITNLGNDIGTLIDAEASQGGLYGSSIGYTLSYDSRRSGLNPNAGILLQFGQDFAGLGGDVEYIRSTATAIAQTRVLNEEVTLRARLEGGMINFTNGGSRITDRFTLGSNVMRGFEPFGIGPRERDAPNDVNDALGGNMYAVASFEAEFPLGLPEEYGVRGGVFYDVGSLWGLDASNANVLYEDFSARHVIGVSVFWETPIGPLRFNFSEALRKERFDRDQVFDLQIATQF